MHQLTRWLSMLLLIQSSTLSFGDTPMPGVKMPTRVKKALQLMAESHRESNLAKMLQKRKDRLASGKLARADLAQAITTLNLPLVLGTYSNSAESYSRDAMHNQIIASNPTGTMVDYYREVSYGQLEISGQTAGWLRAPQSQSYYVGNNYGLGGGGARFSCDLVAAADASVDFSQFDNDGDGYVDVVMIVHTGAGAETGASDNIWSHSWSFNAAHYYYPSIMPEGEYVTNDPRPGYPGEFIKINDYIIQPEKASESSAKIIDIGVFCHELGHALGLPDLYDTDYSSYGIGSWCLMSFGSYGADGRHPETPAHMSAWCKEELGWVVPIEVTFDKIAETIAPAEQNADAIYKIWRDGIFGEEYFLLENRQRLGFDQYIFSPGLLIWHIDRNVIRSQTLYNKVNSDENHKGVDLEAADGQAHMDGKMNFGDAGDPFPGSSGKSLFAYSTNPNSRDYAGASTNVSISNILLAGTTISADLVIGIESNVTATINVQPDSQVVPAEGGDLAFDISVVGQGSVSWTVSTNTPWLSISAGASGQDAGSFVATARPNDNAVPRSGTIIVASPQASNSPVAVTVVQNPAGPQFPVTWQSQIHISDAASNQATLNFGQSPEATPGLDANCGERELPPAPPEGIFDARFAIPAAQGAWIDFRNDTTAQPEWVLRLQRQSGAPDITLSWNAASLPEGHFVLEDALGGLIIHVPMKSQASVTITNDQIRTLRIKRTNEITKAIQTQSGWNLISIPVQAADMRVARLLPEVAAQAVYAFDNAFVPVTELENGKGYWAKFEEAHTCEFLGRRTGKTEIPVAKGWNLIGPFDFGVSVIEVTTDPANIITSNFYSYNNGYTKATHLEPGRGYWVKATQSGTLRLPLPAAAGRDEITLSERGESELPVSPGPRLELEDANGHKQVLQWVDEITALRKSELPPIPPGGVFDVRFANGKNVIGSEAAETRVRIQGVAYPVTLMLDDAPGRKLMISDPLGGNVLQQEIVAGESVEIVQPLPELILQFKDNSKAGVPLIVLAQNTPNPFNPVTRIAFSLPRAAQVRLTIYNLRGRHVATLVNDKLAEGEHAVEFDGGAMSSGVYFYLLEFGAQKLVKKMLLAK